MKFDNMGEESERDIFMKRLAAFNESRGASMTSSPTISKHPLDLYQLYNVVKDKGGFLEVSKTKAWKEIATLCGCMVNPSSSYAIRKQYIKHILPYECKFDRGGIDHTTLIAPNEKKTKKSKETMSPGHSDSNSQGFPPTPGSMEPPVSPYPGNGPSPMGNSYPQGFPPTPGSMEPPVSPYPGNGPSPTGNNYPQGYPPQSHHPGMPNYPPPGSPYSPHPMSSPMTGRSHSPHPSGKKLKGVPSPGTADSDSRGSYPQSGTPVQLEGPYPPHHGPMTPMNNYGPGPGMYPNQMNRSQEAYYPNASNFPPNRPASRGAAQGYYGPPGYEYNRENRSSMDPNRPEANNYASNQPGEPSSNRGNQLSNQPPSTSTSSTSSPDDHRQSNPTHPSPHPNSHHQQSNMSAGPRYPHSSASQPHGNMTAPPYVHSQPGWENNQPRNDQNNGGPIPPPSQGMSGPNSGATGGWQMNRYPHPQPPQAGPGGPPPGMNHPGYLSTTSQSAYPYPPDHPMNKMNAMQNRMYQSTQMSGGPPMPAKSPSAHLTRLLCSSTSLPGSPSPNPHMGAPNAGSPLPPSHAHGHGHGQGHPHQHQQHSHSHFLSHPFADEMKPPTPTGHRRHPSGHQQQQQTQLKSGPPELGSESSSFRSNQPSSRSNNRSSGRQNSRPSSTGLPSPSSSSRGSESENNKGNIYSNNSHDNKDNSNSSENSTKVTLTSSTPGSKLPNQSPSTHQEAYYPNAPPNFPPNRPASRGAQGYYGPQEYDYNRENRSSMDSNRQEASNYNNNQPGEPSSNRGAPVSNQPPSAPSSSSSSSSLPENHGSSNPPHPSHPSPHHPQSNMSAGQRYPHPSASQPHANTPQQPLLMNSSGYPPRGPVPGPYGPVPPGNQTAYPEMNDAYRNNGPSNVQSSNYQSSLYSSPMNKAPHNGPTPRFMGESRENNIYDQNPPTNSGHVIGPNHPPGSTPQHPQSHPAYPKRHPDFMKPEQQSQHHPPQHQQTPTPPFQDGPSNQYHPYPGPGNRSMPANYPQGDGPHQTWNRDANFRAHPGGPTPHPPTSQPPPPHGNMTAPPYVHSQPGWENNQPRNDQNNGGPIPPPSQGMSGPNSGATGGWQMNRYPHPQPPQAGPGGPPPGMNHPGYLSTTSQSAYPYPPDHPMNKMNAMQNRMYQSTQMSGGPPMPAKSPSAHLTRLLCSSTSLPGSPSPNPHMGAPNSGSPLPPPHVHGHGHMLSHQQFSHHIPPGAQMIMKRDLVFPHDSVEATQANYSKRRKLTSKDIPPVEAWKLLMSLKSGLLAESTWALDTLAVLVSDDSSYLYFGLQHLPGLLEILLEHYKKCLNDMFDGLFKDTEVSGHIEKTSHEAKRRTRKWYQVRSDDEDEEEDIIKHKESSAVDMNSDDDSDIDSEGSEDDNVDGMVDGDKYLDGNKIRKTVNVSKDFVKMDHAIHVNIPKMDQQTKMLKSSLDLTFKSRNGKTVRMENAEAHLFVTDYEKKWDYLKNGFRVGKEHWAKGYGEITDHILTHFEPKEKYLKLVRVIRTKKSKKSHKKLKTKDVNKKSNSVDDCNLGSSCPEPVVKKEKIEMPSPVEKPVDNLPSEVKFSMNGKSSVKKVSSYDSDELEEEADSEEDSPLFPVLDYYDSISRRCLCISTLIRNLSFVPGNDVEMCKHPGLMLVLSRLITLNHTHPRKNRDFAKLSEGVEKFTSTTNGQEDQQTNGIIDPNYGKMNESLDGHSNECNLLKNSSISSILNSSPTRSKDNNDDEEITNPPWYSESIHLLRENTLVTIANISCQLDLDPYPEEISLNILDGLLHWAVCPSSYAQDHLPTTTVQSFSPKRLALESLMKLSIIDSNVDLLLATPPWSRLEKMLLMLAKMLNRNEEQTLREFALVLLANFAAADTSIARAIALTGYAIPQLISFIEQSEQSALQVANSQGINALRDNPELMGTTLDMVRRAAICLRHFARIPENRPLLLVHQQRLLSLVFSQILDQGVASIIADVIYEVSLYDDSSLPHPHLVKSLKNSSSSPSSPTLSIPTSTSTSTPTPTSASTSTSTEIYLCICKLTNEQKT
uniref:ARID domain-containing protein n=1 Tax=Tetranychus urticae TaxID=32264 RepID=T1JY34_TETUR